MSAMERFKASKFVPSNWGMRTAITDSPDDSRRSASPVVDAPPLGSFPQNANMGSLGASNAALGASDGDYLHILITSLGNSALLESLSTVRPASSYAVTPHLLVFVLSTHRLASRFGKLKKFPCRYL